MAAKEDLGSDKVAKPLGGGAVCDAAGDSASQHSQPAREAYTPLPELSHHYELVTASPAARIQSQFRNALPTSRHAPKCRV